MKTRTIKKVSGISKIVAKVGPSHCQGGGEW